MERYDHTKIEEAKNFISEYITDKYVWKSEDYEISVYKAVPGASVIMFLVHHNGDKKILRPGGGKSRIINFDMEQSKIINELVFQ